MINLDPNWKPSEKEWIDEAMYLIDRYAIAVKNLALGELSDPAFSRKEVRAFVSKIVHADVKEVAALVANEPTDEQCDGEEYRLLHQVLAQARIVLITAIDENLPTTPKLAHALAGLSDCCSAQYDWRTEQIKKLDSSTTKGAV